MEKIEQEVIINNDHGLHVRPASLFVQVANKFDSSVQVEKESTVVDGKSIIALLSLGVNKGMKVKLIIEGQDAQHAFEELRIILEGEHDKT